MRADSTAVQAETIALIQELIRFNTVNPPGNELPIALYIDALFKKHGIDSQVLIPAENRAALVARIRGDGSARPVLLLSHMDVVGVEADKWSCDPFGGVIREGYLYGRGAIDDKGMLAANIITMLMIQRSLDASETRLTRDLLFVATSDEEGGGEAGIKWVVENHRDLLDAEFALNEGGRTRIVENGKCYLAIQTAEKISNTVTLTARGPAGHAAVPRDGNAIFRLSRALERLSHYSEPVTLTGTTRRFFGSLADVWPNEKERDAMTALAASTVNDQTKPAAVLSSVPVFNAVMRNTISPTMLSAGVRGNVIPAEASVGMNVRTIPGHSVDEVAERIAGFIGDDGIKVEVSSRGADAPPSDERSVMFNAIADSAKALDQDITIVPYLSTGATDSAALRRIGINSYGLLPFPMTQADEERMHGHDERVPIESLHFGVRLIYESILRVGRRDERTT